jgi:hypothetical protein
MILISKYVVPRGYIGLTIFPLIFLKHQVLKNNIVLINHERIHLRQQMELLVIPFFLLYMIEFLYRLIQYKNWTLAYSNISFEREAYENEKDLNYLDTRSFGMFLKYYKI